VSCVAEAGNLQAVDSMRTGKVGSLDCVRGVW
jgi:hypothetical protein